MQIDENFKATVWKLAYDTTVDFIQRHQESVLDKTNKLAIENLLDLPTNHKRKKEFWYKNGELWKKFNDDQGINLEGITPQNKKEVKYFRIRGHADWLNVVGALSIYLVDYNVKQKKGEKSSPFRAFPSKPSLGYFESSEPVDVCLKNNNKRKSWNGQPPEPESYVNVPEGGSYKEIQKYIKDKLDNTSIEDQFGLQTSLIFEVAAILEECRPKTENSPRTIFPIEALQLAIHIVSAMTNVNPYELDVILAKALLSRIHGRPHSLQEAATLNTSKIYHYLDNLLVLLLGVEGSRNNFSMLVVLMHLDLIASSSLCSETGYPYDFKNFFSSDIESFWENWLDQPHVSFPGYHPMTATLTGPDNFSRFNIIMNPTRKQKFDPEMFLNFLNKEPQLSRVTLQEIKIVDDWLKAYDQQVYDQMRQDQNDNTKNKEQLHKNIGNIFKDRLDAAYGFSKHPTIHQTIPRTHSQYIPTNPSTPYHPPHSYAIPLEALKKSSQAFYFIPDKKNFQFRPLYFHARLGDQACPLHNERYPDTKIESPLVVLSVIRRISRYMGARYDCLTNKVHHEPVDFAENKRPLGKGLRGIKEKVEQSSYSRFEAALVQRLDMETLCYFSSKSKAQVIEFALNLIEPNRIEKTSRKIKAIKSKILFLHQHSPYQSFDRDALLFVIQEWNERNLKPTTLDSLSEDGKPFQIDEKKLLWKFLSLTENIMSDNDSRSKSNPEIKQEDFLALFDNLFNTIEKTIRRREENQITEMVNRIKPKLLDDQPKSKLLLKDQPKKKFSLNDQLQSEFSIDEVMSKEELPVKNLVMKALLLAMDHWSKSPVNGVDHPFEMNEQMNTAVISQFLKEQKTLPEDIEKRVTDKAQFIQKRGKDTTDLKKAIIKELKSIPPYSNKQIDLFLSILHQKSRWIGYFDKKIVYDNDSYEYSLLNQDLSDDEISKLYSLLNNYSHWFKDYLNQKAHSRLDPLRAVSYELSQRELFRTNDSVYDEILEKIESYDRVDFHQNVTSDDDRFFESKVTFKCPTNNDHLYLYELKLDDKSTQQEVKMKLEKIKEECQNNMKNTFFIVIDAFKTPNSTSLNLLSDLLNMLKQADANILEEPNCRPFYNSHRCKEDMKMAIIYKFLVNSTEKYPTLAKNLLDRENAQSEKYKNRAEELKRLVLAEFQIMRSFSEEQIGGMLEATVFKEEADEIRSTFYPQADEKSEHYQKFVKELGEAERITLKNLVIKNHHTIDYLLAKKGHQRNVYDLVASDLVNDYPSYTPSFSATIQIVKEGETLNPCPECFRRPQTAEQRLISMNPKMTLNRYKVEKEPSLVTDENEKKRIRIHQASLQKRKWEESNKKPTNSHSPEQLNFSAQHETDEKEEFKAEKKQKVNFDDTGDALLKKDDPTYQYKARDISMICLSPIIKAELNGFHYYKPMDLDKLKTRIDEAILDLASKPILWSHNISDIHWTTVCLLKNERGQLIALYKDSYGNVDPSLSIFLKSKGFIVKHNSHQEQINGDVSSCAIFSIENKRIIARGIKINKEQFIANFEHQTFCTLDHAQKLRRDDFAELFKQGVIETERLEEEMQQRSAEMQALHHPELLSLIAKLQTVVPDGIVVKTGEVHRLENRIVVASISPNEDMSDYTYRIGLTNDLSIGEVKTFLKNAYGWMEGIDYSIAGRYFRVTNKLVLPSQEDLEMKLNLD